MENLIYPYKLNDDYYKDVGDFADEFSLFVGDYNLEEAFNGLCIGVYWNEYKNEIASLSPSLYKILSTLSNNRNKSIYSKDLIDDVRGMLFDKHLVDNVKINDLDFNLENYNLLLNYLDAIGDYVDQLPHFKKDLTQEDLDLFLDYTNWFLKNSDKYLSTYTQELEDYFKINNVSHKMNEDVKFFNSSKELYHLNMLGAELMNRFFVEDFKKRKRKAILLPTCMRINSKNCKAIETNLGPKCGLCNKNCNVFKVVKQLPDNYEYYLISHSSTSFSGATRKDLEELGIIGVTCVLNLISGGWKSSNMGIPPQCVVLNRVACSKHWLDEDIPSTINIEELKKRM